MNKRKRKKEFKNKISNYLINAKPSPLLDKAIQHMHNLIKIIFGRNYERNKKS